MPYLSVDLDARKKVALLAAGLNLHPGIVMWGLEGLWEYAWTNRCEVVSELVLIGCCGGDARLPVALEAFGFLERVDAGWRVRGAARYLRIRAAQSAGGRASKSNLIPGGPKAVRSGPAERQPSASPGSPSAGAGALHRAPSTEHRAPESQHLAGAVAPAGMDRATLSPGATHAASEGAEADDRAQPPPAAEISRPGATSGTARAGLEFVADPPTKPRKAPKADKPPDPRIRELSDLLVRTYKSVTGKDYFFQGAKDGAALPKLVGMLSPTRTMQDIANLFAAGLRCTYGRCTGIADLASRPNDPRWAVPSTRPEDQHHSATPGVWNG